MAASAAPRAHASDRTSRRGSGNGEPADAGETEDVERDTVQEKTLEFFRMCDVENKGFITRRDMQVSF